MADINWSLTGTASAVIRNGNVTGAIGNIKDDNEATNHNVERSAPPDNTENIDFDQIVTFSESVSTINRVEIVNYATGEFAEGGITSAKVYLYYSAAYNEILNLGTGTWAKQTFDATGTWNDVTKIKFTCTGTCYDVEFFSDIWNYTYELRAWGPASFDIGIRIRTSSGTIKIGVKDLVATHKLRIRKGGTTYGIPLLATNDPNASPIRIYDGSAIKSLPEVA